MLKLLLRQRVTQSQVLRTDFVEAQLLQCLAMGSSALVEIGSTGKALFVQEMMGVVPHTLRVGERAMTIVEFTPELMNIDVSVFMICPPT